MSEKLGPIKTDQDAVNAILALCLTVNVERWRTEFAVGRRELPLTSEIADAVADLQRSAREIRRRQAPDTDSGEGS